MPLHNEPEIRLRGKTGPVTSRVSDRNKEGYMRRDGGRGKDN